MCDDATFGERLRAVRHERGLTQPQLAERLERGKWQDVSDWERGVSDIRLSTVRRLAAALSVDTAELVRDE